MFVNRIFLTRTQQKFIYTKLKNKYIHSGVIKNKAWYCLHKISNVEQGWKRLQTFVKVSFRTFILEIKWSIFMTAVDMEDS